MSSALPYHEPTIQTLLIQSSFLIVLNGINHVLDSVLYSGLVGQILAGIAWGVPGGNILDQHAQEVIVQLGYIGLILLVFEGEPIPFICQDIVLTAIRRPLDIIFVSQGKPVSVHSSSHHWNCCAHGPLVRPFAFGWGIVPPSVCGWRCALLNQPGHDLYPASHQRPQFNKARRRPDVGSYDG